MSVRLACGAAAFALCLACIPAASATTVVATTAEAGGSVSLAQGDTLLVKLPGSWKPASDLTPELVLDNTTTKGTGAHARTTITFSADAAGSAMLKVRNTITKRDLSILVDVMSAQN